MLTPIFSISQTAEALLLDIRAPYSDIASTEVSVAEDEFRFYSKPYFLRLHLPGRIVETGNEILNYDFDAKEFRIKVTKETYGEHFEGLEFISSLLTKKNKKQTEPLIEVVEDDVSDGDRHDGEEDADHANDVDEDADHANDVDEDGDEWLWDQHIPSQTVDDIDDILLGAPKYGFNNKASGLFSSKLSEERKEITDMPDPDSTSHSQRRRWKLEHESSKFDSDHYLADFFDDEGEIQRLIDADVSADASSVWSERWRNFNAASFTDEEKFTLKNLPRREILLTTSKERRIALLGILDVFLASCYDFRSTEGESTVESGWTINKISAVTSCFSEFETVFDVVVSFLRRSLIFPLHRNWDLATKCCEDAIRSLRAGGKVAIVKRLVDVYKTFILGDPRYILNDLYITDMILWAQSPGLTERKVEKLTDALQSVHGSVKKSDLGLELDELEEAAEMVAQEEEEEEESAEESSQGSLSSADESDVSSELDSDDDDVEELTLKINQISC